MVEVLTKTYHTEPEGEYSMALEYNKIVLETPLEWKPGKNVTVEMVAKKAPAGARICSGNLRTQGAWRTVFLHHSHRIS